MKMMMNAEAPKSPAIPEPPSIVVRQMSPGLPIPDLVSYYVLENDRKLYLDQEVGSETLTIQRMILRWNMEDAGKPTEERKPIHLYIMSPGGDVDYMWSLIDAIEASVTPVITVDMGVAASAAALIFLAGHRRYMMSRSRLLIHEGSARLAGDAVKVMDATESYKKLVKAMKDYVLARTRISPSAMNRQRCHDWELDTAYCLEHGVCDGVVTALDEIL